jgi:hypothetical protein
MKKCNYHFYTETLDGIRTYVHLGAYKKPERTAQWKALNSLLNNCKVEAIGYELY